MFHSDECPEEDVNEYSEINLSTEANNSHQMPRLPYAATNVFVKYPEERSPQPVLSQTLDYDRFRNLAVGTPDRSIRSTSVATSVNPTDRSRSRSKQDGRNKVQVRLKLSIKKF